MAVAAAAESRILQRTFLGHPVGLYVLFFTEMWERFSYYGMRALLMLYMVNYFRWTQKEASGVYKWYTSLVYLTPLLGGFLADRFLGNKRAVIIGAILMAIGHFLMAFEAVTIFFMALAFLIFGNGFFKPNMSTQVGRLYPANDARRDGAYTIFYMGINLGAFLSPLVCGYLAASSSFGYHYGFAAAGVGMVIGLCVYVFGLPLVQELDASAPAGGKMPAGDRIRPDTSEAISAGPPPLDHTDEAVRQEDMMGRPDMMTDEKRNELLGKRPDQITGAARVASLASGAALLDQGRALTEQQCEQAPSAIPAINRVMAKVLIGVGVLVAIGAPVLLALGIRNVFDVIFFELIAVCSFMAAIILRNVHNAVRDRVLAVYALAVFVVFFWGGFEQAGNVLNVWADQSTNRYLWTEPSPPPLKPDETEKQPEGWFAELWNPIPTAWFQSINALAIFLIAPLFAWMWTALDRRGFNPSIPLKMGIGIALLAASFALMIAAAQAEDGQTRLQVEGIPASLTTNAEGSLMPRPEDGKPEEPFFAGRLKYDAATKTIILNGALPIVERDRILAETAPADFVKAIKALKKQSAEAGEDKWVEIKLEHEPKGFDWSYTGFTDKDHPDKETVKYDPSTRVLKTKRELADKDLLALEVAASDPVFRSNINKLVIDSSKFRVSLWWLFWAYILQTLGELCLSPVGLSMVSKLAPAKYATMLMGLWLLTSTFGQFLGGELGEHYGEWTPTHYFVVFFIGTSVACLILFLFVRKIGAMMHGVK